MTWPGQALLALVLTHPGCWPRQTSKSPYTIQTTSDQTNQEELTHTHLKESRNASTLTTNFKTPTVLCSYKKAYHLEAHFSNDLQRNRHLRIVSPMFNPTLLLLWDDVLSVCGKALCLILSMSLGSVSHLSHCHSLSVTLCMCLSLSLSITLGSLTDA